MPRQVIEFGEWVPDGGPVNNEGMWFVKNALKINDNYETFPSVATGYTGPSSGALAPVGTHYHIKRADKLSLVFWGSSTALHVLEEGQSWVDASSAVYSASSFWRFASFGPTVVATNGINALQGYTVADTFDSAANFADLLVTTAPVTANILPKHLAVFKGHLFAGNITMAADWPATVPIFTNGTLYQNLVWWSDHNNITRFGDPDNSPALKSSSYFLLHDGYGEITGFAVASDALYVFKERAIYRCDGAPFTFVPIAVGTGCQSPTSICVLDGSIYFWSGAGPAKIEPSGQVVRLGLDSCYRSLSENNPNAFPTIYSAGSSFDIGMSDASTAFGVADPVNQIILWGVDTNDSDTLQASGVNATSFLVYNTRTNRFYFGEAIDGFSSSPRASFAYPFVSNDASSVVLGMVNFANKDASNVWSILGFKNNNWKRNAIVYFRTPFIRFGNESSVVVKIRPILDATLMDSAKLSVTVSVITRQYPFFASDGTTFGSETVRTVVPAKDGWITINGDAGLMHSIGLGIKITGTNTSYAKLRDISGVEVEWSVGGRSA